MRLLVLGAVLILWRVEAERPKEKDATGFHLTRLTDIGEGCDRSAQHGIGIVNGFAEHCEKYNQAQINDSLKAEYEAYRCKNLRLKARLVNNECKCLQQWYGAFCHLSNLCDTKDNKTSRAWFQGKCIQNACYHDGEIAIGKVMVECVCPVPWDGRHCERLACWRKTHQHQEKRFRNEKTECVCGEHYTGENCDKVISCVHGNFSSTDSTGKCDCEFEYYGEICDRKKVCTIDKTSGERVCSGGNPSFFPLSSLISLAIFSILYRF